MANLQEDGVGTSLGVGRNAAFASNRAEVGICTLEVQAPLTRNLIGEELWVHTGGIETHLPATCAVHRCGLQQRFQVIRSSDDREEITAEDHETDCGPLMTPASAIRNDPIGRRGAFGGQAEGGHIEIDADQLPLGGAESGQDAACATTNLKNWASRFRRYPLPIRQVAVGGGG